MPATLSNRNRGWLRPEVTFGLSANIADNGAGAIPLHVKDLGLLNDDREMLEFQRQTGENEPTPRVPGGSMGKVRISGAWKGKASAAGVGTNMSAVALDPISLLIATMMAPRVTTAGAAVTAGGAAAITTVQAVPRGDLLFTANGTRGQWARNQSAASPYTVAPAWTTPPINGDVAYGTESFVRAGPVAALGPHVSLVVDLDGVQREMTGCRASAFKVSMNARGIVTYEAELTGLIVRRTAYNALPIHTREPNSELVGLSTRVAWGPTYFGVQMLEVNFNPKVELVLSSEGTEGIGDIIVSGITPTAKITPQYAVGFQTDFETNTMRELLIQLGNGALVGGVVNSTCIWFERAQIISPNLSGDGSIVRQDIQIEAKNPEYPTALGGAIRGNLVQIARA